MGRRLRTFVHVDGRAYGPGDKVPTSVAKRIGDHAWEVGGAEPEPSGNEPPPRSGRGSGVEAWRSYAEANGVGIDSEMSREQIIGALEQQGVIEQEG